MEIDIQTFPSARRRIKRFPTAASRPPMFGMRRGIELERAGDITMRCALTLVVSVSVSNFNPALVPPSLGMAQQVLTLAAWLVCILASYLVRPRARLGLGTEIVALCAFYALACWSVLWANQSAPSLMKSAALVATTIAAFRVAMVLSLDSIVACAVRAYALICSASFVVIVTMPDVGIDQSWTHEGYWQGVFESKQALGATTAMLIILTFHRWTTRSAGSWNSLLIIVLAGVLNFMSGSRDALGLAALGCVTLLASMHSKKIIRYLSFAPIAFVFLACLVFSFLWSTGEPFIPVFGVKVDLTERVLIWSYALSRFGEAPMFGFGLDGFWTNQDVLDAFNRQHGWVLDNYHDGFLAILMETGMIGMALFAMASLLFGLKARWLARADRMKSDDHRLMVVFVTIMYFANLTESYFLRSTNGLATLTLVFTVLAGRRRLSIPESPSRRIPKNPRGTALAAAVVTTGAVMHVAPARAASPEPAFAAILAMGGGVNILGYDGIWDGHPNAPFRLSNFSLIHRAGFRNVRINIYGFRHMGRDGKLNDRFLRALDTVVEAANDAGLIPILDEHDSEVCQVDPDVCETKLKSFWQQVSVRYAGRFPRLAFEVLNEPGGALTRVRWKRLLSDVLSIIRLSNPERIVVVAVPNGQDGPELDILDLPDHDRNIIITIHYYRPLNFTHQGAPWSPKLAATHGIGWGSAKDKAKLAEDFDTYSTWAKNLGRPILLGEFGVFEGAPWRSRIAWNTAVAEAARTHGWAWDYWQFDHDFAIFDTAKQKWDQRILDAIMGTELPMNRLGTPHR